VYRPLHGDQNTGTSLQKVESLYGNQSGVVVDSDVINEVPLVVVRRV